MSKIIPGRRTADVAAALGTDSFVVFLVDMRINKPWRVRDWSLVARAMPPMIRELEAHPELGMLGSRMIFSRTITVIQYWRSFDDLERFAKGEHHLPAWREFNAKAAASEAVGICHETLVVNAYEAIYNNMPNFGLAAATTNVAISAATHAARDRVDKTLATAGEPA